jgi:hypothetical protein
MRQPHDRAGRNVPVFRGVFQLAGGAESNISPRGATERLGNASATSAIDALVAIACGLTIYAIAFSYIIPFVAKPDC